MKLAFIGLGRMGSAMARNLLRAGHEVTVYNRSREKADALAADGARVTSSPAEACGGCDAAISMLSDDAAVEAVVFGPEGIATGAHIGCSTISTAMARRLAEHHKTYVSAPVFGRPEAAEAKKLIVVAGGAPGAVERFQPVFDAIGRRTFVAGDEPWQANALKLCGNFMIASMLESFSEAFSTLRKAGVDPNLFVDTMVELFGSPVYAMYGRLIAGGKFSPAGFTVPLGLKDVRLVLETAHECRSPMPMASLIRDHLLSALAQGQEELDWSSVAQVVARNAGLDA